MEGKHFQFIALTHKGMEASTAVEVREITSAKTELLTEAVLFSCSIENACEFAYKTQSTRTVMLSLNKGTILLNDATSYAALVPDVSDYLTKEKTFQVTCDKETHELTSQEINDACSTVIKEKTGNQVSYKNHDITFLVFTREKKAWFGIDLTGFDLSKRPYRVFLGTNCLKGTIAYGLIRIAGYSAKKTLLDPFCRHGIIPIEAALYAQKISPHYYAKEKFAFLKLWPALKEKISNWDNKPTEKTPEQKPIFAMHDQFTFVSAAKKNAQLAGVNKEIEFSRADIDWLDIKLGEASIDCIVSYPPQHAHAPEKTTKLMHNFFNRARHFMNTKGKIALIVQQNTDAVLHAAQSNNFKLIEEHVLFQGQEELPIKVFEKQQEKK